MIRVYCGHHKCASQYVRGIFTQVASLLGLRIKADHLASVLPLNYHDRVPWSIRLIARQTALQTGSFDCLCLENADNVGLAIVAGRGDYRGFHVIRDPRDVLVSAYFSHRYSHPIHTDDGWITEFRRQLSVAPDVESGLLLELEFNAAHFEQMASWHYANPCVYETRYETLIANPLDEFVRIFTFLNITVPRLGLSTLAALAVDRWQCKRMGRPMPRRDCLPLLALRCIVTRNAFERKTQGRHPGQEDTRHHYRKGVSGDWRTYFTPRVMAAFKERYGEMVIQLGYETSMEW